MSQPVVVFGAGATKACGGPLTAEILPGAFALPDFMNREDFFPTLDKFLRDNFHLPADLSARADRYPPLPLLISLVDIALDRKHALQEAWNNEAIGRVRESLDYAIFALLQHSLRTIDANPYRDFLQHFGPGIDCLSLNYDIIADNTLINLSEDRGDHPFPDYCCDVATPAYQERRGGQKLLKLHGSLNWLHCPGCNRLDVGLSRSGSHMAKVLDELYIEEESLERRYSCHGSPCLDCGVFVRPVLITPTHLKDYRNPHISQIWYRAERTLRQADRAFLVGYSLPDDDIDVIYLLKRGLSHLEPDKITVIEYDPDLPDIRESPVGRRYANVFGDDIDWHPEGFQEYTDAYLH